MILGQQLKALRKAAGLTYRDLKMHHNTIKAIETGASYNSLNKYLQRLQSTAGEKIAIHARWAKPNYPADN
jgi:transcriptional regulator with XRE-family HTH domain